MQRREPGHALLGCGRLEKGSCWEQLRGWGDHKKGMLQMWWTCWHMDCSKVLLAGSRTALVPRATICLMRPCTCRLLRHGRAVIACVSLANKRSGRDGIYNSYNAQQKRLPPQHPLAPPFSAHGSSHVPTLSGPCLHLCDCPMHTQPNTPPPIACTPIATAGSTVICSQPRATCEQCRPTVCATVRIICVLLQPECLALQLSAAPPLRLSGLAHPTQQAMT